MWKWMAPWDDYSNILLAVWAFFLSSAFTGMQALINYFLEEER